VVLAGAAAIEGFNVLPDPLEPVNNRGAVWTKRDGVLLSGEDTVFRVNGQQVRASVATDSFKDTLGVLAGQVHGEATLADYFKKYPFRMALQPNTNSTGLAYYGPNKTRTPQLQVSQGFLTRYYTAQSAGDGATLTHLDTGIAHELWHIVRDATSHLNDFSSAMRAAETAGWMSSLLTAGYNAGDALRKRDPHPTQQSQFVRSTIPLVLAGLVVLVTPIEKLLYKINPAEIDAYAQQGRLVALPEVAKHRGQYFSFERVSNPN
jgi:hypothetical protein